MENLEVNQEKPLQTKEVSKEKTQNLPKKTQNLPKTNHDLPFQTQNLPKVNQGKPEALTIKTEKEAKDFFVEASKNLGLTQQQMFSILIEVYQKFEGLEIEFTNMVNSFEAKEKELADLQELLETEKNNIKTEVKEVEKLVPVALQGTQFICELSDVVANNARKCRPFMVKDGIVKDGNPNEIVSVALEYFLRHKYDHVLEPVFRNKF